MVRCFINCIPFKSQTQNNYLSLKRPQREGIFCPNLYSSMSSHASQRSSSSPLAKAPRCRSSTIKPAQHRFNRAGVQAWHGHNGSIFAEHSDTVSTVTTIPRPS